MTPSNNTRDGNALGISERTWRLWVCANCGALPTTEAKCYRCDDTERVEVVPASEIVGPSEVERLRADLRQMELNYHQIVDELQRVRDGDV